MTELVRTVADIFSVSGRLSEREGFEHRPQQAMMAEAVAGALESRQHLIVEAPTGVGKSLAYLIPTILYATQAKRKAIVSTHTKNLQEQLARKDIPIVSSLLGKEVNAVVLKGRRNYLCTSRLQRALDSTASLFNGDEPRQLHRILKWAEQTRDGDMEGLGFTPDPTVWEMVCSEKGICSTKACGSHCFFQRAKLRARTADLVVMNHALFFTLTAIQGSDEHFIFDDDFVIFDEAHTLETVAGSGLGRRLSRYQTFLAIHRLYNPRTKKGLAARRAKKLRALCEDAEAAAESFFDILAEVARSLAPSAAQPQGFTTREVRIRRPYCVDNTLSVPLKELQHEVKKLESGIKDEDEQAELAAARAYMWEVEEMIDEFLEQPRNDFVYWVEFAGARGANVTLCASPVNIAQSVGPMLFKHNTSVIMTSATLAVNSSLDYFKNRLGAGETSGTILDTPFDFRRQMRVSIARAMPEPDSGDYASELPKWIMRSVHRTGGRALVLFTSSWLMRQVAGTLSDEFVARDIKLLVQGSERPRHELLEEFKRDVASVLFGLDSFWMGVDVPGEALEHVIITRLPFAVPNHPLIEAKIEAIEKRGGNPFAEFTLPEAALKLRQGVGRLIRSRTDKGIVTILDSRVLTKTYGRILMQSLPRCEVELFDTDGEVTINE